MKIIVLDAADGCVEVWPVLEEDFDRYGGVNAFNADLYLIDHRGSMDNVIYHCFSDDIPVYWQSETIPYISL